MRKAIMHLFDWMEIKWKVWLNIFWNVYILQLFKTEYDNNKGVLGILAITTNFVKISTCFEY